MFFDTNIIISLLDKNGDISIRDLVLENIKIKNAYISSIVLAEVLAFQGYTHRQADLVFLELSKSFKVKTVDVSIVKLAAEIARNKRFKTGKKLKITDAIIAATTLKYKSKLFTLDLEDFKGIDNLHLV